MAKLFIKTAGLLLAGQLLFWVIVGGLSIWLSPRMSGVLTVCFFAYAPTIKLVDLFTNYVGLDNMIIPVYLGVVIGIFLYSIIGATARTTAFAMRDRRRFSSGLSRSSRVK